MEQKAPLIIVTITLALMAFSGCVSQGGGDPAIYGTQTGGTLEPGLIKQAGSSTVFPLAEVWAEDFGNARGVQIQVSGGGSGAGASGLCNGEIDLGDMSREMKDSEKTEKCAPNGIEPVQWKVAFDGLSVVVAKENSFVQDLTVEQLEHIFRAEGHATTWDEVDPEYPAEEIHLCYPDSDSGTYEYFNEVILDEGQPRTGESVQQSPDDNVLVTCLSGDTNAIGYFGYAYVVENTDRVRTVAVDGVQPEPETIADGSYTPLSRPIYIYTDGVPQGILYDYMAYVLHPEGGQALVPAVGYVALDPGTRGAMMDQLAS